MKRYLVPVMLLLGAVPAFAQSNTSVTPETRQKVEAVRAGVKPQMKPLWQDARAAREALRAELAKAQPDDGKLTQLEDRLASDRQQMQALRTQSQAQLARTLSPRERAELILAHKHFGRGMHGGHRHGGGGDNGGGESGSGE
ncbi:MAG TPA: periplasmic heavy metal sensor [Polyangia bacterium]|jgi:Spy/CpxP family protein refolding chaperone